MGSGRAREELTQGAKKAREIRRREKTQRRRLVALGVPETVAAKLDAKAVRTLLKRPVQVRRQYAPKA